MGLQKCHAEPSDLRATSRPVRASCSASFGCDGDVLQGMAWPLLHGAGQMRWRSRAGRVWVVFALAAACVSESPARERSSPATASPRIPRDAAATFRPSALAGAPEPRELAQTAYCGGASSVIDLLDDERAGLAVQLHCVDLLERLATAELEVDLASGVIAERVCD